MNFVLKDPEWLGFRGLNESRNLSVKGWLVNILGFARLEE
jgi:hypothetical protein